MSRQDNSTRRIVILGGGFGGAYCARALERQLSRYDVEVCLVDRNNYFIFYPFLIEAGTGSIEPRHAIIPLRSFLNKAQYLRAEVIGLDPARQQVSCRIVGSGKNKTISYEHVVIALGSITRMPNVPGLREWAFEIKSLADAIALRDRAIHLLELADAATTPEERHSLLHVVIVGGNFTGVELAGELQAFMQRATRLYKNVSPGDCDITLIEMTERILPALDPDLARYAAEHLSSRGVQITLRRTVRSISQFGVVTDDGVEVLSRTVIWAAGVAPNPLVRELALPVDKLGYILCDRDLRVSGFKNVWAVGDCAVIPDPDGEPYPAMAQFALREGEDVARNIVDVFRGRAARPCDIHSRGAMVSLGGRKAVAKVYRYKVKGFPAWFIRQTYYLMRIPGWSRKLRVAFDWTLNILFSREIVQSGVRSVPPDDSVRKVA